MAASDDLSITTARRMVVSSAQVWRAWTTPTLISQWWGPDGFVSTVKTLDVRPGGRFDVVMHGPDGTDYVNVYVFDEVVDGERLVYTNQGSEEFGLSPFVSYVDIVPTSDDPTGGGTEVTLRARFASEGDFVRHRDDFGAVDGARQLLARLELAAQRA